MALAVEVTLWSAAGGYHHRAGEFQFLLSLNYRSTGVSAPVAAAVVVVAQVNRQEYPASDSFAAALAFLACFVLLSAFSGEMLNWIYMSLCCSGLPRNL